MKKDKFFRDRGGTAVFFIVSCSACKAGVLTYQKDGNGALMRCYLNRIVDPSSLEVLQDDKRIQTPKDLENLTCPACGQLIGVPMLHHEGRLAFRLVPGGYQEEWLKQDKDSNKLSPYILIAGN